MKVERGGPGFPMLWRRHVPFAPEDSAGAAGGGLAAAAEKKTPAAAEGQQAAKPEEKKEAAPAASTAPSAAAPSAKPEEKKDAPAPDEREKRLDEYERQIKERADAFDTKFARMVDKSRLSVLRQLGADPDVVSDEDLLALAPKVDPDEPAGLEALKKFRDTRKGFFRVAEVGPQERLGDMTKAVLEDKKLPPHLRDQKARMLNKLFGGNS